MGNSNEPELPEITSEAIRSAIENTSRFSSLECKSIYYRYEWLKYNHEKESCCTKTELSLRVKMRVISKIGRFNGPVIGFIPYSKEINPFVLMACDNNSFNNSYEAIDKYINSLSESSKEKGKTEEPLIKKKAELVLFIVEDSEWKINWVYSGKFNRYL